MTKAPAHQEVDGGSVAPTGKRRQASDYEAARAPAATRPAPARLTDPWPQVPPIRRDEHARRLLLATVRASLSCSSQGNDIKCCLVHRGSGGRAAAATALLHHHLGWAPT